MNEQTIQKIIEDISPVLQGKMLGKMFQLSRFQFAFDFRPHFGSYFFFSVEPTSPRLYLIERRFRDLEKQSETPNNFLLFVRKRLSSAILKRITKDETDRIVRLEFLNDEPEIYTLIIQLTGRASNCFLLDSDGIILDTHRESFVEGQKIGDVYSIPKRENGRKISLESEVTEEFEIANFESLSKALDSYFRGVDEEKAFAQKVQRAQSQLNQELSRRERLRAKFLTELKAHGTADENKRLGDLLLANIGTFERNGNRVIVTDYFDENMARVEIEIDENVSLKDAAEKFFKRYAKAKRANIEIGKRLTALDAEILEIKVQQSKLDQAITEKNEDVLAEFTIEKRSKIASNKPNHKQKQESQISGVRRYLSSDGYEILVGRTARDNDNLTVRIAKSLDWWLHAADYGGSHVVVRNKTRGDLPHKTLIEAAQLAAKFSQAKDDSKVAVHYTQKKFVQKPKGANVGLVRLASFRTILVEPKESVERI